IIRMPSNGQPIPLPTGLGDPILSNPQACQTSPTALPLGSGGRWRNVFLGQVVTLTLNTRLDPLLSTWTLPTGPFCIQKTLPGPNGIFGGPVDDDVLDAGSDGVLGCFNGINDDPIKQFSFSANVVNALDAFEPDRTVASLLDLANLGLAGMATA